MKWKTLKEIIEEQIHENAEVDFIVIGPKTSKVNIKVRNYGGSFSVSEIAINESQPTSEVKQP